MLFDEAQIRQALLNLLRKRARGDARRRRHPGARPPATGWPCGSTSRDQGGGIPEEIRARVFDPFFSTKGEGTGLGLAITRQILEAHGGAIDCETGIDKAPDGTSRGTRFSHQPARWPRRAHGKSVAILMARPDKNAPPTSFARWRSSPASIASPKAPSSTRGGGTVVLCTASIDNKVPSFLEGKGKGLAHRRVPDAPARQPAAA